MAVTSTPAFLQVPNVGVQKILPADTTTLKTIFTAGSNGSKVESIMLAGTDSANKDVQIYLTRSATDYLIGTTQLLANAGFTNAIAPKNFMNDNNVLATFNTDNNGNRVLHLMNGDVLKAKVLSSVTASKEISIIVQGFDY
jgi:hypothetical protein